jgi:hypothetical protein
MIINRGNVGTLGAEWRVYEGGPLAAVTGVQITITPLAGGAPVLGPTATGVTTPATGVNAYAWNVLSLTPAGDYLVVWSGTDGQGDLVSATEIVTVTAATGATLAWGDPYATLGQLHAWLGIPDSKTDRDPELSRRLASSTEDINRWCHRVFWTADVATVRTFHSGFGGVDTHDFWTAEDLAITPYVGQAAGVTWDTSTVQLEPLDGIVDMQPGWPYNRICGGVGGHPVMDNLLRSASTLKIAAKWGWAACPPNVNTACLILASADNKAKDTPFGVAGFGDYAVRIRSNPMAQEKLDPYVHRGTAASSLMVATG